MTGVGVTGVGVTGVGVTGVGVTGVGVTGVGVTVAGDVLRSGALLGSIRGAVRSGLVFWGAAVVRCCWGMSLTRISSVYWANE